MNVNREHKDRLFRAIFGYEKYKENLLSLYNALNKTNYTELDDLEITTIDDVVYMEMKNDISCILDSNMSLMEHQSTLNPNMPLRGFMYFGKLYSKYIMKKNLNIYSKNIQKVPKPQYYAFYNGKEELPDCQKLRLSDSFIQSDETHEFEWTATMLNINLGHNRELMSACKVLHEYAILIEKIREKQRVYYDEREAVIEAINECIEGNILADFLLEHKSEVIEMCLTEYDKERTMKLFQEEEREAGRAEGREAGRADGLAEGRKAVNRLNRILADQKREQDIIRAATDEEYQQQLLKEYNLL